MTEWKTAAADETEAQFRQYLSHFYAQSAVGIAITGVLAGLAVSQTSTVSSSVVIGRGLAVSQTSLTAGAFPLPSNADKTLDVLGPSPMGALPRFDVIVFNPSSGQIEAVIGVPNASPVDPTLPTGAVPLARLRHTANATTIPTSRIDDLRVTTTLKTGVGSWQTYPAKMQTSGVDVNLGSGSVSGRYMDVGKTRFVHIEVIRAADSGIGNNTYTFTLPPGSYKSFRVSGSGHFFDKTPFKEYPLTVRGISQGTVVALTSSGARLANDTIVWATDDEIVLDITIELA